MSRRAGQSTGKTLLLGALFGLAAGAAGLALTGGQWQPRKPGAPALPGREPGKAPNPERVPGKAPNPEREPGRRLEAQSGRRQAARLLHGGAVALSFSVLVDSALEHYRGGFYNRIMFVAPVASGLTLAVSAMGIASPRGGARGAAVYGAAALTGLIGSGFHTWNIGKREGGWRWLNLFYGAPLAAPIGLVFAGLLGLAADRLVTLSGAAGDPSAEGSDPSSEGGEASRLRLGRVLALAAATGLVGTASEAGLLHFRGAFHDPYMFLPVTIPPLAAAALLAATIAPSSGTIRAARLSLATTRLLGFAGVGFHAFGVQRNMGGWRNWSQMVLQGPPLPAPPSFTGMALAGEAALKLQEFHGGGR